MPKCNFNFATLLKSHFGVGVLLKICFMFSEHLFLGTPFGGCFCIPGILPLIIALTLQAQSLLTIQVTSPGDRLNGELR